MEDSNNNNTQDQVQPDPLLQPGTFIDPNPTPNSRGKSNSKPSSEKRQPKSKDVTDEANRPDWLPEGWIFKESMRISGNTAGTRDKYFIEPVSNRRFRSKKEVLLYLQTGATPQKRKQTDSADNKPQTNSVTPKQAPKQTPKRKKSEAKAKVPVKFFDWDNVPGTVKWHLTDIYEPLWRPLVNGVDMVPESSKQEWGSAFAYLTMQDGGKGTF